MARLRTTTVGLRLASVVLALASTLVFARSVSAIAPGPLDPTQTPADCQAAANASTAIQLANSEGITGSSVHMRLYSPDGVQTYFSETELAQVFCNTATPFWIAGEELTIRVTAPGYPNPTTAASSSFFVACGPTPTAASTGWFLGEKTCLSDADHGKIYFRVASVVDNLDPTNSGTDVAAHIEFLLPGASQTTTGGIDAVECTNNPAACAGVPPPGTEPTPELDSIVLFSAGALLLGGLYVKRRRGVRAR